MYKLREAREEDFSRISMINNTTENIHLAIIEDIIEKDFFKDTLDEKDRRIYVVEKTGKIAAFMLFRIDSTSGIIYIDKLSIVLDFDKKGLDEHLYHKIERLAERTGIKQLVASITTKNPDVHDFFVRKGWIQDDGTYSLTIN